MANRVARGFGSILRQHRAERGWSQQLLSLKSRVDRSYISQIESGIHVPTITVLWRLARALDVAPSKLIVRLERML